MAKIGALIYLWIDEWTVEKGEHAVKKAAEIGFDFIEYPLQNPEEFDALALKKATQAAGIDAVASIILPKELHMPTNPDGAVKYLKAGLEKIHQAGGTYLCGCLAYATGVFTGAGPTKDERQIVVDCLGDVALRADELGIGIGLEVVSRIDTYLYNTLADARETILEINMDNVTLHADTYHMNLEEDGFYKPLVESADVLAYIHMSESNRGLVGEGTVDWDDVFKGLKDANYEGPLMFEAFTPLNPSFTAAFKTWRASKYTPDELGRKGLAFLKEKAAQYGL